MRVLARIKGAGGPINSKPAVRRVVARFHCGASRAAKDGLRVMRQSVEARRLRIMAGWVVVEMAR